jgi:hypothetical protein
MILGASHITLASTDLVADLAALAELGYKPRFIEENLPSHPAKERFLSQPYRLHSLALTGATTGLPIELVQYDKVLTESRGCMTPVFDRAAPEGAERPQNVPGTIVARAIDGAPPILASLPRFRTPAYFSGAAGSKGGLVAVEIPAIDLVAARNFWEDGLGYRFTKDFGDAVRLDFDSPMVSWRFAVLLRKDGGYSGETALNSRGMACLSMICTDLSKDRDRLLGIKSVVGSSGSFDGDVNAQRLSFELFEGPGGVFVELFQVNPIGK